MFVKKYLSSALVILMVCLIISPNIFANASESIDRELFRKLGFSEFEIENLSAEEIQKFGNLKTEDIELVQEEVTFYRIARLPNNESFVEIVDEETALRESELENQKDEEFLKQIQLLKSLKKNNSNTKTEINNEIKLLQSTWENSKSSSWLKLTGTVSKVSSVYFFKLSYEWLSSPIMLLNDVIGISHSDLWTIAQDTQHLKNMYQVYTIYNQYVLTDEKFYYDPAVISASGMAFEFNINNGRFYDPTNYVYKNRSGYMIYRVQPSVTNMTSSNMYGAYFHQTVSVTPSISITSGDISITPVDKYNATTPVNVQFPVSN
ncbi:MAG: hypothetical protein BSOLF_0061 [Candidatus Carbobacillus altaicus]|uniref:Uncharacterized protein n=1 Tax=Candidatus Carbonibacillus altaicus TaxID=2163959 RepID=A0A2R6XXK8_9BACL|nr:MAG: hypothetical protein BSOLF_0061 [Candidatus Carbobacillus altaicus]